jgi:DNA-binding FadR family transcriptional regulator
MNDELIRAHVSATRVACGRVTARHLKALHDSVEQACRVPAAVRWERKAAAHAKVFNVLADAANDPSIAPVLSSGAGLAYDLMVPAGRVTDSVIANSRRRILAHLRARDAVGAAPEMETHLRVLYHLWRLANCTAHRAPRDMTCDALRDTDA